MRLALNPGSVLRHGRETLKRGFAAWLFVIKLMIPALAVTRILLLLDLVGPLARIFEPFMALAGLPPEAALVWVSGMIANLYVSISVYLAIAPLLDPALTLAQMTILGGMCLVAHNLLVEGQVCRAAGLSFWRATVFRILAGFMWGFLLHQAAALTGWGAEPARIREFMSLTSDPLPPWDIWLRLTLKQLGLVLLVIESLMLMMELVKYLRLNRLLEKLLGPLFRLAGLGEAALMVTVIGCVVGLAYGGGLIVAESRSGRLTWPDVFGALVLMCFFHSIVVDTLLMWSLGGSWWCFLAVRLALALLLTALVTRLTRRPFWRPLLMGRAAGPEAPS